MRVAVHSIELIFVSSSSNVLRHGTTSWEGITPGGAGPKNMRLPNKRTLERIPTQCRGVSILGTPVSVYRLSGSNICGWVLIAGWYSIAARWWLPYVRSPPNEPSVFRLNGHIWHQVLCMWTVFISNLSLKVFTAKILNCQCPTAHYQRSSSTICELFTAKGISKIIACAELHDKGRPTVFVGGTVDKSLHDHVIHTDNRSANLGPKCHHAWCGRITLIERLSTRLSVST